MELSERKLRILQAIISDFVYSAEPVGSRTISKRLDMNLSPATIRNEMSDLEEMGYLTHPHTSAGRVPSDKAYRLYVDKLMSMSELPEDQKNMISAKLSSDAGELDATIERAAELLSEMTNLISFAVTPSHRENKLKYVRFLSVDERTVVLMIVAEDGKVTNQAIRVNSPYSEENLELMSKVATVNFEGRPINDILTADIIENFRNDLAAISALASSVVPSFIRTLERMLDVDLFMEGYSNIFSLPEFNDISRARSLLSLMDRREEITDALVKRGNGLIITIGGENSEDMKDCSVITADYRVNGKLVGKLGVIGPTRMKYGEISSVIKYMTDNLNDTFSLGGDTDDE